MTYIVDYTQDETGKWTARVRDPAVILLKWTTPARVDFVDCVTDAYELVGWGETLEVGDVREWSGGAR